MTGAHTHTELENITARFDAVEERMLDLNDRLTALETPTPEPEQIPLPAELRKMLLQPADTTWQPRNPVAVPTGIAPAAPDNAFTDAKPYLGTPMACSPMNICGTD